MSSIIKTKRPIRKKYLAKKSSTEKMMRDLAKKFENIGYITDPVCRGRIRTIRIIKKIVHVKEDVKQHSET